jgi:hypothetical protein
LVIRGKVASLEPSAPIFAHVKRDDMFFEDSAKFGRDSFVSFPVHEEKLHDVSLFNPIHYEIINFP